MEVTTERLNRALVARWEESLIDAKSRVEPNDVQNASKVQSLAQLEDVLGDQQKAHPRNIAGVSARSFVILQPSLSYIERLTNCFADDIGGTVDTTLLWGWIFVSIQLCQKVNSSLLNAFAEIIKDLGDYAQLLSHYRDRKYLPQNEIKAALLEVKIRTDTTLTSVITCLHEIQDRPANTKGGSSSTSLPTPEQALKLAAEDSMLPIRRTCEKIRELTAHTLGPLHAVEGLSLSRSPTLVKPVEPSEAPGPTLPCVCLPLSKNRRFYGRSREVDTIDGFLTPKASHDFCSLAIHGLGGVGKTQTALAYAYEKSDHYDAILWLHAETDIALTASLSESARRLKLAQVTDDANSNALLVKEWLEQTNCKWLLVYDNAEENSFTRRFWPASKHGSILMTTRNRNLGLPSHKFEVKAFEEKEGAEFLLHMMATQNIGADVRSQESERSARQLSKSVGGHALALTQMACLISERQNTLTKFSELYHRHPKAIHGLKPDSGIDSGYKYFINTVFREDLGGVKGSDAFTLLGIVSFLVPDRIPQELFQPTEKSNLPHSLQFCSDIFSLDEALKPLLKLALLRKESTETGDAALSLHRLVQKELTFFVARVAARFLHSRWPECEMYIQHVHALVESWQSYTELRKLKPSLELCKLLTDAGWFIHELGTYDVLERFLDAAFKMFDEGDIMQKAPMLQAKLLMISGVMFDNWGQFENSIKQFEECLDIAQKNLDANDEFLGGIYNDLGNVSESMDEPQKAVEWHKKAWQIRSQTNDPTGEGVGHSQSNTARSLLMLGEDEEAGKMMEAAELCFHKASAWFHESHVHFCKGNLYYKHRRYEDAKTEYNVAKNLLIDDVKALQHVRTAACLYKLGSIAIDQLQYDEAVDLLKKALSICDARTQNVGDRARILNKLAQAQSQVGDNEAARSSSQEAMRLYTKVARPSKKKDCPETYDFDLLVCALHR